MIGGWKYPLKVGTIVELYDCHKASGTGPTTIPCYVLREATREEYLAQQKERKRYEDEIAETFSIANTATYFYDVSID